MTRLHPNIMAGILIILAALLIGAVVWRIDQGWVSRPPQPDYFYAPVTDWQCNPPEPQLVVLEEEGQFQLVTAVECRGTEIPVVVR